jgi:hypothetical protein
MLGHSRQRDAVVPKSTVHRDGLDALSRPSLYLGIKVNRPQGENLGADSHSQTVKGGIWHLPE